MGEVRNASEALATIKGGLSSRKARIAQMMPAGSMAPERFMQLAVQLCESTPALLKCEPMSVIGSMLEACSVGLSLDPVLNQAHVLPYKGKGKLIVGYRGIMSLARRGGGVKDIYARVARKGDLFEEGGGTDPYIIHKAPPLEERGPVYKADSAIIGAYAVAELREGGRVFKVLDMEDIKAARACAQTQNVWNKYLEAQCCKTAVRRLEPWLPLQADALAIVRREDLMEAGAEVPPTEEELREVDIETVEPEMDQVDELLNELGGIGHDEAGPIPPLEE